MVNVWQLIALDKWGENMNGRRVKTHDRAANSNPAVTSGWDQRQGLPRKDCNGGTTQTSWGTPGTKFTISRLWPPPQWPKSSLGMWLCVSSPSYCNPTWCTFPPQPVFWLKNRHGKIYDASHTKAAQELDTGYLEPSPKPPAHPSRPTRVREGHKSRTPTRFTATGITLVINA